MKPKIGDIVEGGPGSMQPHGTIISRGDDGIWRISGFLPKEQPLDISRGMSLEELIAALRRAAAIWFRNDDLLLLEELIRRVHLLTKERENERHIPTPPLPG